MECLDRSGVDPAQICFEISEAAVVANIDAARRFVGVLHGMGCQFALDDFGSDLGSFSRLKNLPMDYLKIDGSFMHNLARDSVNQAMVTATIKLARSLNFKVIAEQVEDAAGPGCGPQHGRGLRAGLCGRASQAAESRRGLAAGVPPTLHHASNSANPGPGSTQVHVDAARQPIARHAPRQLQGLPRGLHSSSHRHRQACRTRPRRAFHPAARCRQGRWRDACVVSPPGSLAFSPGLQSLHPLDAFDRSPSASGAGVRRRREGKAAPAIRGSS